MEQEEKQKKIEKIKKVLEKAISFKGNSNLAIANEFVDIGEKIDTVQKKADKIAEEINLKLTEVVDEVKKKISKYDEELVLEIDREELKGEKGEQGDKGEKGVKGDRGEKGEIGIAGLDGEDGADADEQSILEALQEILPTPKDGSPDTPEEIVIKLQTLKGEKRLDAKAIKNLPKFTREVIREMGAHGGAYETPIKAGTNITVRKDASGAFVISSTAGGSGLTKETPSGIINDSNVTFTVTHEPFFINVNGAIYEVGDGAYASYVAGTITLNYPVGTGGFIKSYY